MANGQDITVHIEGLPPMHFPLGTSQDVIQAAVKKQVASKQPPQPEGVGTKVARGAALGAFSGAGIPETMDPVEDLAKNLGKQAGDLFGVYRHPLSGEAWKKSLLANPLVAIPRSLGTTGVDVLRDLYGANERGTRGNKIDPEKTAHDLSSLLTQLALLRGGKKAAETPISEGAVAKTVGETAKRTGREFLGISGPAEKAAREESHVAAKEELGKFKEKTLQAQAKDIEKTEAVRGKKAGEVREAQAERIQRSKLETKKSGLGVLKDRVAEKVAQNLDLAEKAEQASLNKRYAPFNRVIDAGKFDLAELENAIGESRKEVFKGTVQNEPIFNSILSRIKNKVEAPSGETRAVPGENMIKGDQLRGYITELGNEMFKGELPADVYKGLKNVRQAAKDMVQGYVDDAMGKQGGEAYRQLQRDWSNYEQTWYDRSSGSPLRNALKTIRTTGRNVSVYREVANQLLREVKGEQALQWLGKKKQFGANPDLVAQLRRVDREMKSVKVPVEVGDVQPPTLPKPTEVKPSEPTPFNPEQWRRETIRNIAKPLGRPTGWDVAAIGYALRELVKGKFPWGLTYPVGKRVLQYLTDNPRVVEWLAKDQP